MALRLFNTLTRKKEVFKPLKPGLVTVYTCGPTVYDYAHLGNFRTYVFQDVLRRYLKYKGFRVRQVMNLTDVDDKTIKGSRKEGVSLQEFTARYEKAFFEDLKSLNIEEAEFYPKATEHIKEMVSLVKGLMEKGLAYKGRDGSIYYDISKFKPYGKLSHIVLKELKAGARVKHDEYEKLDAGDFALWKAWDNNDGDVFWMTELGRGRPGWHIECSAMSMKYLGPTFDMHSGGVDLIFPHHENEIAQSEGSTNRPFSNYWVHSEHLIVDGRKMSKSLGNFFTLRDVIKKGNDPKAVRYLLLSSHYRSKLNFTSKSLDAAKETVRSLENFVAELGSADTVKGDSGIDGLIKKAIEGFEGSMDDDLGITEALSHIFSFVRDVNKLIAEKKLSKAKAAEVLKIIHGFDTVLGLGLLKESSSWKTLKEADKDVRKLIEEREKARREKDWKKADELRNRLKSLGVVVEDTPSGVRWKKV